MASRTVYFVLAAALFLLCTLAADAHHIAGSEQTDDHRAVDNALVAQQLDSMAVLDQARSVRKSAINPNDDKVALIAAYRQADLKYTNAAHADKMSASNEEASSKEDITGKALATAGSSPEDVKAEDHDEAEASDLGADPDEVRGRHHHRRLLRRLQAKH